MLKSAEEFKFLEAESARIRIEELKEGLNRNKASDLNQNHSEEIEKLKVWHQDEIQKFNVFWDEKIADYEEKAQQME